MPETWDKKPNGSNEILKIPLGFYKDFSGLCNRWGGQVVRVMLNMWSYNSRGVRW